MWTIFLIDFQKKIYLFKINKLTITDVTFSFDIIRIVRNGSVVGKAAGPLFSLNIIGSPSSG
jgi:hypothetical protein